MFHRYVFGKVEGKVTANGYHGISDDPYAYIYVEKCKIRGKDWKTKEKLFSWKLSKITQRWNEFA